MKLQIHALLPVYDRPKEHFWTKWSPYLTTNEVTSDLDSLPKSQGNFPFSSLGLEHRCEIESNNSYILCEEIHLE